MLEFKFIAENSKDAKRKKMSYYMKYVNSLDLEGCFKIIINGKVLFDTSGFSIFEFINCADKWAVSEIQNENMYYDALGTDDNPLISFLQNDNKWKIESKWQLFVSETLFERSEIVSEIYKLIESVKIQFNLI